MSKPTPEALEAAITELGETILDADRTTFTFQEAETLAFELGYSIATPVIHALKALGFGMEERSPARRVRTISSNNHDRWSAYPCHGGSGWEQISGFAGQER